jgi:hypothetical protein
MRRLLISTLLVACATSALADSTTIGGCEVIRIQGSNVFYRSDANCVFGKTLASAGVPHLTNARRARGPQIEVSRGLFDFGWVAESQTDAGADLGGDGNIGDGNEVASVAQTDVGQAASSDTEENTADEICQGIEADAGIAGDPGQGAGNETGKFGDGNNGHGNDEGGVDPSNPGKGNKGAPDK